MDTRRPTVRVAGDRFQYEGGAGHIVVESRDEGECVLTATHNYAGGQLRATRRVPCPTGELVPRSVHLLDLDGDDANELYFALRGQSSMSRLWFALVANEGGGEVVPEQAHGIGGDELSLRGYALPVASDEFERIGRALWLGQAAGLREVVVTGAGENRHLQGEYAFNLTPTGIGHPNKTVLVEYGGMPPDERAFYRVLGSRHDGGFAQFYAGDVDSDGDDEFFVFATFGCSDCFQQPAEVWAFDDGQSLLLATGVLDSADHGSDSATALENVGPVEAHVLRLRARDHLHRPEEQVERR